MYRDFISGNVLMTEMGLEKAIEEYDDKIRLADSKTSSSLFSTMFGYVYNKQHSYAEIEGNITCSSANTSRYEADVSAIFSPTQSCKAAAFGVTRNIETLHNAVNVLKSMEL